MSELECITIKREKFNAKSLRCMRLVIVISISDCLVQLSDVPHLAALIMSFRIPEYIRYWETHPSPLKCLIRPQVYPQLEMTFAHIPNHTTAQHHHVLRWAKGESKEFLIKLYNPFWDDMI